MRGNDCITCAYAQRDRRGRYKDSCAGYANCDYDEYKGPIDLFPEEKMKVLLDEIQNSNVFDTYFKEGAKYAIEKCIEILNEEYHPLN